MERTPNNGYYTQQMVPQWSYYETREDVDRLLKYLNKNGIREKMLATEITKFYQNIVSMLPGNGNGKKGEEEGDPTPVMYVQQLVSLKEVSSRLFMFLHLTLVVASRIYS